MKDLEKELKRFSKELQKAEKAKKISGFALIGALAVSARSKPRATKDIDFLVSAEEDFFKVQLPRVIKSMGYSFKIFKGDLNDPINGLVRIYSQDGSPLVDIIPVFWKWQNEMVESASQLTITPDLTIPVALAEDLVILKLKAGGPQDILDVKELLKVINLAGNLDKERLFLFAKRARVMKSLEKILQEIRG